jgi:hypothetical protein
VKSCLPGFPVKTGCLPVAKVLLRPDLSLGAVCREIGLVGWFLPQLSYLPFHYWKLLHYQLLLLAPISHCFWRSSLFHIGVRMPVSPSLALGLGSGSDSGSTSAAGPASVPPLLPPPAAASAASPPPGSTSAAGPTSVPPLPPPPAAASAASPPPGAAVPVTPPKSPQRSQQAARQLERNSRTLGSPENCRTPAAPPVPSLRPPTLNGQEYHHLPANLAAQLAALPPLPVPIRSHRHRGAAPAASSVSFKF